MKPTDAQQIDLDRIRKFIQTCQTANGTVQLIGLQIQARELAPMINELCDLVEGSDLLPNVEQARLDMMSHDDLEIQRTLDTIQAHTIDPEDTLPKEY